MNKFKAEIWDRANQRCEYSYIRRAPLSLLRGHWVTKDALNHACELVTFFDPFEPLWTELPDIVSRLIALDDTPFWDVQEAFAAVSPGYEVTFEGRGPQMTYLSRHHIAIFLANSVRRSVLRSTLFSKESSVKQDFDGETISLTLEEASLTRQLGFSEARRAVDIIPTLEHYGNEIGEHITDKSFHEEILASWDQKYDILLKKEFFRAWKLFFPGKPGKDYDTIEQASPEEREEILRQAEELSTGKKRGRRSKENEYVELYRKFKHTQKEYYSSLDDFIKKERLRIKKNTLSGRFNDIEEKAAGERGKEATLEQLDAYQKTLNCSEKLGG